MLIKKVVLFDDRIDIYYNYITKSPDGEEHQDFSFYSDFIEMKTTNYTPHEPPVIISLMVNLYV